MIRVPFQFKSVMVVIRSRYTFIHDSLWILHSIVLTGIVEWFFYGVIARSDSRNANPHNRQTPNSKIRSITH